MKITRFFKDFLALAAVLVFAGNASAYTLSLSDATGSPGSTVDVSVNLSSGSDDVFSLNFGINYDPNVLEYKGFTWSSEALDCSKPFFLNVPEPGDSVPPIVLLIANFSGPEDPYFLGDLSLGTIQFKINGSTNTQSILSFDDSSLEVYSAGDLLQGGSTIGSTVTITQGNVPVPEPSSVLLIGSGIACLVACRRRKKHNC